jgi:hypothetical protein
MAIRDYPRISVKQTPQRHSGVSKIFLACIQPEGNEHHSDGFRGVDELVQLDVTSWGYADVIEYSVVNFLFGDGSLHL